MRKQTIALATMTGTLIGCGKPSDYQWGMPYQGAEIDEDEDDDPPEEDGGKDPGGPASEGGVEADSGGAGATSAEPPLTTSVSVGESSGSSGEPVDSADTGMSPYQGGWDVGDCQDEMTSSIADFMLTDSYGDQIRLYDFCHKAIMLTAGSFW